MDTRIHERTAHMRALVISVTLLRVASAAGVESDTPDLASVEVVLVDDEATGYATFQSHNEKVVSNQHGIFLAHIRTRNEPYTAQEWRLVRLQNGGRERR